MEKLFKIDVVLGRILLSLIFVMSGVNKLGDWSGTAEYMANHGMPMVNVLLAGAVVFEIVGGLLVMTGFMGRIGAAMLIVFLIPATLIFHNFWALEGQEQQMQMIMFLKNLSIGGGLLFLLGMGPKLANDATSSDSEPQRSA